MKYARCDRPVSTTPVDVRGNMMSLEIIFPHPPEDKNKKKCFKAETKQPVPSQVASTLTTQSGLCVGHIATLSFRSI